MMAALKQDNFKHAMPLAPNLTQRQSRKQLMYFDEVDTPNLVEKVQNYSIKKEQVTIPDDLGLPFKSWLDIDPTPIKLSIPK